MWCCPRRVWRPSRLGLGWVRALLAPLPIGPPVKLPLGWQHKYGPPRLLSPCCTLDLVPSSASLFTPFLSPAGAERWQVCCLPSAKRPHCSSCRPFPALCSPVHPRRTVASPAHPTPLDLSSTASCLDFATPLNAFSLPSITSRLDLTGNPLWEHFCARWRATTTEFTLYQSSPRQLHHFPHNSPFSTKPCPRKILPFVREAQLRVCPVRSLLGT
jgi:hypothetical protein